MTLYSIIVKIFQLENLLIALRVFLEYIEICNINIKTRYTVLPFL